MVHICWHTHVDPIIYFIQFVIDHSLIRYDQYQKMLNLKISHLLLLVSILASHSKHGIT